MYSRVLVTELVAAVRDGDADGLVRLTTHTEHAYLFALALLRASEFRRRRSSCERTLKISSLSLSVHLIIAKMMVFLLVSRQWVIACIIASFTVARLTHSR